MVAPLLFDHCDTLPMSDFPDLPGRIEALERAIGDALDGIANCVEGLRTDDGGRYLVMERLPRLGSAAVPALRKLAATDPDREVQAMAALVALELNDLSLAERVVAEIEAGRPLAPLAARKAAQRQVNGTEAAVLAALSQTNPDEVDELVAYLDALGILGAALPVAQRDRLQRGPWQVTSAIERWFSGV
jgi:hypothetical protein